MITPTHERPDNGAGRGRRLLATLRRGLPDEVPDEREFFLGLATIGVIVCGILALVANSIVPVVLQYLGVAFAAGALFYIVRATVDWVAVRRRRDWIESGGGTQMVKDAGDADALAELVQEWRGLCAAAGISIVPPVQIDPFYDDLELRVLAPTYTLTEDGRIQPRLRIGPGLLAAPARLRRQLLAQQVGHLLAGHATTSEAPIEVVAGLATSSLRTAGLLVGLQAAFGLGVLGLAAADEPLVPVNEVVLLLGAVAMTLVGVALGAVGAAWSRDRVHTADQIAADRLGLPIDEDLAEQATGYDELVDDGQYEAELTNPQPTWMSRWQAVDFRHQALGQPTTPGAEDGGATVVALPVPGTQTPDGGQS